MTTTAEAQTATFTRPEGITDGRWSVLQQQASLMLTGHMPWCTDHEEDRDGGWCRRVDRTDVCTVTISNGTLDGSTIISLDLADDLDLTELSTRTADVIANSLDHAAKTARLWNTAREV